MKLRFLGTGGATDFHKANSSILVESETKLLLDCGPFMVQKLWQYNSDPEFLDAIFISHTHGDHILGLPFIILYGKEGKRKKPLKIILSKNNVDIAKNIYPSFYPSLGLGEVPFSMEYEGVDDKSEFQLNELNLKFAYGKHFLEVLAVRVSDAENSFCYAPDTNYCPAVAELAKGCDLLIHEAALPQDKCIPQHASPYTAAQVAKEAGVKKLALVHLLRNYAKQKDAALAEAKAVFENTIIPDDGDVLEL